MLYFQQKPAQRGSGQFSIKDLENFEELTHKLKIDIEDSKPSSDIDSQSSERDSPKSTSDIDSQSSESHMSTSDIDNDGTGKS